jgi:hypothetical protein
MIVLLSVLPLGKFLEMGFPIFVFKPECEKPGTSHGHND